MTLLIDGLEKLNKENGKVKDLARRYRVTLLEI